MKRAPTSLKASVGPWKSSRVDAVCDFDCWHIEGQGVVDNALEVLGWHVFTEERVSYGVCYLLKGEVFYVVEKLFGQWLDVLGHVETFVFCQAFDYCLFEGGYGGLLIGAVVFHVVVVFCFLEFLGLLELLRLLEFLVILRVL